MHTDVVSMKSLIGLFKIRITETSGVHKTMKQLKSKTATAKKSMLKRKFK